jgi:multicomponent Na+:H+ antiporter subunit E
MRSIRRVALLVVLWLLAWGDASVANVLSGIAVAGVLLVAFPVDARPPEHVRVRPVGVLRLVAHVVVQLLASNVYMARQILARSPGADSGVVVHRLGRPSEEVVTVMSSLIALSPGMMTVDVDPGSASITVHVFVLHDEADARRSLQRLEDLVTGAVEIADRAPAAVPTGGGAR